MCVCVCVCVMRARAFECYICVYRFGRINHARSYTGNQQGAGIRVQ